MEQLGGLAARVVYLFSPLLAAAALAGIVQHYDLWTALKRPIDGGATFRGRRVFGDNKTWRGVACALVGCIATVTIQRYLIGDLASTLAVVDYGRANPIAFGATMGGGAMLGELPNSFVKRRLGIAPGAGARGILRPVFYLWDQVDFLTTTWPLLLFWARPSWQLVLASFVLAPAVHQSVTIVGFLIGARRRAI
jgi:CDP-2,3-bis-(O-geranylgeranyl)-sn-glycerol synthase